MSALSTLKKFLRDRSFASLCNHTHPNATLEWFLEKYWGKKEVRFRFNEWHSVVISTEYIEYIDRKYRYRIYEKVDNTTGAHHVEENLILYSANYCKYCRDKRREFWEKHREIIERLPQDAGKFVMNLPMTVQYSVDIMLSDTKMISKYSHGWYINGKCVDVDGLLREFRKEYNAAKRLKFSAKCWRFSDVSVLYRA